MTTVFDSLELAHQSGWAAIDVEGDGNDPQTPVEIAVVQGDGRGPSAVLTWTVNPGRPLGPFVSTLHGLTDEDLATAPTFDEIATRLSGAISGRTLVAHAAKEDLAMLARVMPDVATLPTAILDTQRIARNLLQRAGRYSLEALVTHLDIEMHGQGRGGFHTAAFDAMATARLFGRLSELAPKEGRLARHYVRCGVFSPRPQMAEPASTHRP